MPMLLPYNIDSPIGGGGRRHRCLFEHGRGRLYEYELIFFRQQISTFRH
jgi:hypothetical protein